MTSSSVISITSRHTGKLVEFPLLPLQSCKEALTFLTDERAPLWCWIKTAKQYYKEGYHENYAEILEQSRDHAHMDYKESEEDQMIALDGLAAYYAYLAKKETNRESKRDLIVKATRLYTAADKIIMLHQDHLLGRAYLCLMEPDKIDQADTQFNFVLDQNPNNILALLGKARIFYIRNDVKTALSFYRKALKLMPFGLADIRVGIGMCFYRLGKIDMAKLAFERALQIDKSCVGALIALATLRMNENSPDGIKFGMQFLTSAYNLDSRNPTVLNMLANHFFYKGDLAKVEKLATFSIQYTNNDFVRAFSFFLLARCFHAKGNYDNAYNYYYQATQLSSSKFTLPWYGLGQCYLLRGDIENAIKCFEKVMETSPDNLDTIKILCVSYLKSSLPAHLDAAKKLYEKVTLSFSDSEEGWIGLGEVYENSDLKAALEAYFKALKLIEDKNLPTSPEIYNNIGSVYFRIGEYENAKKFFLQGLEKYENNPNILKTTTRSTLLYNLARVYEHTPDINKSESIYRDILKEYPEYTDCYLRLGCIYRNRGNLSEASEWFSTTLKIDQNNIDALLHIANLHLTKSELGVAQKKYEKVLQIDPDNIDLYAFVSLANIWLIALQSSGSDLEKKKKYTERALSLYKQALKKDPRNICAANGIGCILAHCGYFSQARDIFSQCREATADIPDIWINLGHIYVEHKQYINAIKMYESCYEKFYSKSPNLEILLYLTRAYYRADQLISAKKVLLKTLFLFSRDTVVLFNISLILQKISSNILKSDKSSLPQVESAISDLELAERNFGYLAETKDRTRIDPNAANVERRTCCDLISQANYFHLQRAKQQYETDIDLRKKHLVQVEELNRKKAIEEEQNLLAKQQHEKELYQKRMEYLKSAQQTLLSMPDSNETQKVKTKKKKNKSHSLR